MEERTSTVIKKTVAHDHQNKEIIDVHELSLNLHNQNSNQLKPIQIHSAYQNNKYSNNYHDHLTKMNQRYPFQNRVSRTEIDRISGTNSNISKNSHRNKKKIVQDTSNNESAINKEKKSRPWFTWIISVILVSIFIIEIIYNWLRTSKLIDTNFSDNPLIGPSPIILINMGASFPPCMHSIDGITDNVSSTRFPCLNSTELSDTGCTLSDLCGFEGVSSTPNQWYRFILSIFLHVGFVHIITNLFTQFIIAGEIERKIGVLRMIIIYFASGIFGFILGSNFSSEGLSRMGCSGSLFGILAISLLDLIYNWKKIKHPKIQLCIHLANIIINFVLGLLPGVDNFSHVGGFVMGLLLGIAILGSPKNIRRFETSTDSNIDSDELQRTHWYGKFFYNRPKMWWIWWFIRFVAFNLAVFLFVLFTVNFYSKLFTCSWCIYISCIPVNGWCNVGKLTRNSTENNNN